MIRYLKGKFFPQPDGNIIIETNSGIGFLVTIPSNSPLYKNYDGEEVKVYTLLSVREDDLSLYGFSNMEELSLFRLLTSVNGVGAKAGMALMSILPLEQLKQAIAEENISSLTEAQGVGKRTAQRIVLELKDKVEYQPDQNSSLRMQPAFANERREAVEALIALGYMRSEAEEAVGMVPDEGLSSEEYIKNALKNML
ncbi:MAG: Holliday junction branch migration protein RuvA [Eubacteriales bacterium]|nr:Holliday junction branch migration protein RuvA [Eubacteriales bacterium]